MSSGYILAMREAEAEAEKVLQQHAGASKPIDPFEIAKAEEIHTRPLDSSESFTGALMDINGQLIICYSTTIQNQGFQRFTFAHELGHYFLPGHPEELLSGDGVHRSKAGFASQDRHEKQADCFAAALLMPRDMFSKDIHGTDPGLDTISKLAQEYAVSLSAAAIRYATLADTPVAVVFSDGAKVLSFTMSSSFKEYPKLSWPKRNTALPMNSATAKMCRKRGERPQRRTDASVDLADWFDEGPAIELFEEAVQLGSYERILTVLTGPEYDPDEDDADDDEDIPRWR